MLGRGLQSTAGSMNHRHRIFHGDRLPARRLNISLGTPQTGKNEGFPGGQQMGTIKLGSDMHHEIEVPHRLEGDFRIGHGNGQVAAKTDQSLRAPIANRLDGLNGIMALVAWRLEPEYTGQYI